MAVAFRGSIYYQRSNMILSAETQTKIFEYIKYQLDRGLSALQFSSQLTTEQLGFVIDQLYQSKPVRETAATNRSMSKSLCCFLHELQEAGRPAHYSKIRDIVKVKYKHMTNDYATAKYWRLIEQSSTGHGHWKLTDRGRRFLVGDLAIAEFLTIKDGVVIKSSDRTVTIADFEGFNYVSYNEEVILGEPDDIS